MQLGNYTIERELARGGMGAVYIAHDPTGRRVAIKLLLARNDPHERERFRREAESLGRIDHPNVVGVHGFGQDPQGRDYLVLTLVEGESLDAKLKREGPMSPHGAVRLARTIAEALAAAHAQGVLHRDMKPANILIRAEDGAPVVTDFGLARVTDQSRALTQTGTMHGTPAYMPPEQAEGQLSKLGPASDVYGLGALLFALVTGRPPFQGNSPINILKRVLTEAPPRASTIQENVPRSLERVLTRCLAKEPEDRYPTAEALGDELDRFLNGELEEKEPRGWTPIGLLALAVVTAVVVVSSVFFAAAPPAPPPPKPKPKPKPTQTAEPERVPRRLAHPKWRELMAKDVSVRFVDGRIVSWAYHQGAGSSVHLHAERERRVDGQVVRPAEPGVDWRFEDEFVYDVAVGGDRLVALVGRGPNSKRPVPASEGKRLVLLRGSEQTELMSPSIEIYTAVALSRDGNELAVALHHDGKPWIERYRLVGAKMRQRGKRLVGHLEYVQNMVFGPKDELFSVSGTGTSKGLTMRHVALLYDAAGKEIGRAARIAMLRGLAINERFCVFGDTTYRTAVVDRPFAKTQVRHLESDALRNPSTGGKASATGAVQQLHLRGSRAFLRASGMYAVAGSVNELRIWDVVKNRVIGGMTEFKNLYSIDVSDDGRRLAIGLVKPEGKKSVEIWPVEDLITAPKSRRMWRTWW